MKRKTTFLVLLLVSLLLTGCVSSSNKQDDEGINYLMVEDADLNDFAFAYYNNLYMSPDIIPLLAINRGPSNETLDSLEEKFFNEEYFKTKALLFLEFVTCSSEIEASKEIGGITIKKLVYEDNKFTAIFNLSSDDVYNEDNITIPFVLEIEKNNLENYSLDMNVSKYEVDIRVINSLSSSRGSCHYEAYK